MNLELRPFGETGLQTTCIGLGLAALGRPGYINLGHATDLQEDYDVSTMRQHAHAVLDAAWQNGIRYYDAARSYGRAEEFLASWLNRQEYRDSDLMIGSKWGYTYSAEWNVRLPEGEKHEVKDLSLGVLERQIAESKSQFSADTNSESVSRLDLYQIHSATIESGVMEDDAVLNRLAELRDEGLLVGFSVSGPGQADTIRRGIEIERGGSPLFASVQATWNILEQSAGSALSDAHHAGRGVIIKEALANGRLTARNQDQGFVANQKRLFEFASRKAVSIDAIAMACAVRQPWANVVLSGAATVEHLQSNLKCLEFVGESELDEFLQMPETPDEYWDTRSRLAWN